MSAHPPVAPRSPASAPTRPVAAASADAGAGAALALHRAIFANSTEAIAIVDLQGHYLEQNAAHARLLGYSADDLHHRTPAIHLGEERFATIATALASDGHWRGEIESRTKDGRQLVLELSAFAVRDADGSPICFVGIKRDITESRRTGEELTRRYEELESVHRMTEAVAVASLDRVYEEALGALQRALHVPRASVLLFDDDGVMRFKAWRGLSDAYRAAVEGHTPWPRDVVDPQPVIIPDVERDPALESFRPVFAAERIRALVFLPLVAEGRLLGKFMLYYEAPHRTTDQELRLARTIASHIAVAISRRRSELALRESEERYRRLVEACPVGVLVHGEGRILFANPMASALLGASSHQELLDRPILDFVHPDFHGLFHERVRQLRDGAAELPAVEKRFVRLDGSTVDVEVTRIGFSFRGRPAVQMVVRDVTDRKRTEEARRLLFDAGTALSSSLDHEATLRNVAGLAVPALADWCLVDLTDDAGAAHRLVVAHADPAAEPAARTLRRHALRTEDHAETIERVVRTARAELDARPTASAIDGLAHSEEQREVLRRLGVASYICVPLSAHGRTLGTLTFLAAESGRRYSTAELTLAEEIARRAALAVDNARLYREAREANRAKSQFLATMSHELRTPLNAIAGYTELMEMGVHGPVSDAQREDLRRIRLNQQHLLGLINDVLSFARLETGRLEFDITDVVVEETLAAVRAHIEPQLLVRQLRYEYRGGDLACTCRADRDKLRQIVLNLLSNAMKFSNAGGRVTLDWELAGDSVAIHVSDTGRGIPPDKLDLIFEPFVQLDASFSARMEGTGLGLAISRELARSMGGEISVASSLGEGSTFTLTLPRT